MASKFRSLFTVVELVDLTDGNFYVKIQAPGWISLRSIFLPVDNLPKGMVEIIDSSPGIDECEMALYAYANLSAERASDLDISGPWELHKFKRHEDATRPLGFSFEHLEELHWDENGKMIDE